MKNYQHLVVGLTGGIGSGKTTVSDRFKALGATIVDADIIARDIVAPGSVALQKITEKYGTGILLANGQLDRAQLRGIVFQSEQDKKWLNQLTHPLIRQEIVTAISAPCDNYVILVAPLLLENGLDKLVDRVLVIDANEEQQIARTSHRDKRAADEVKAIMASQISRDERLSKADDVIDNSVDNSDLLSTTIAQLHEQYLRITRN
ncbi:dephospho-CoA kinase [Thalassotalea fusca]